MHLNIDIDKMTGVALLFQVAQATLLATMMGVHRGQRFEIFMEICTPNYFVYIVRLAD
jgi:hypothetical protein